MGDTNRLQDTAAARHERSPDGADPGLFRRAKRKRIAAVIGLALALTLAAALTGVPVFPRAPAETAPSAKMRKVVSPEEARRAAGERFLNAWIDSDGRVVRRDQGNDTVSEGQAYGMLIALGMTDEAKFDSVWTWTRQHLQRPDGLLAWRWVNGVIVDDGPAADADLDTARALIQAGKLFGRADLTDSGKFLASSVLTRLTTSTTFGLLVLPGLWARLGEDYSYNPSYAAPATFEILAESTGDLRWKELQLGARSVTRSMLAISPLPPDWARVSATGGIRPLPGPTGQGPPVQYGYDASRFPLRFAESCVAEDRALAAAVAPSLVGVNPLVAVLDLGGGSMGLDQNAVSYTARAASRAASGDIEAARDDLDRAEDVNAIYPTYYGSAWIALARDLLDSSILGGCPALQNG